MPLTDVTFDLTQTAPVASTAGFTRTIRENLQNEGLVQFGTRVQRTNPLTSRKRGRKAQECPEFFELVCKRGHASRTSRDRECGRQLVSRLKR